MGGNGLRFMVVAGSVTAAVFAAGRISSLLFSRLFSIFFCSVFLEKMNVGAPCNSSPAPHFQVERERET
ncbi:hypothetical protein OUZ56_027784 [Daphnia magna]|uniref:Secreted protein n=1 Tax=Daphnia magna TaxID=35525 RepID=A0ABR0B251_9CRUS|nr:hypothetical protein OUZ56_027784 [Daphnia magna]